MQEASQGSSSGAASKSKLDNLSREDLIRFLKKQVDSSKDMKNELSSLRNQLEGQSKEISSFKDIERILRTENCSLTKKLEEFQMKHDFLQQSIAQDKPDASADELLLKARVIELEQTIKQLTEESASHCEEKRLLTDQVIELRAKLSNVTSRLDDTNAELTGLKDSKASADLFSLELADYEKKVDRLEIELKESNKRLATQTETISDLKEQLQCKSNSENNLTMERNGLIEENQKYNNELCEEKVKCAKLSAELRNLQETLTSLQDDRGTERMGLGKELSSSQQRVVILEDAIDALKSENESLMSLKEQAESRLQSVQDDYDNFKSRAKFVLEQKVKSDENDIQSDRIAELESSLTILKDKEDKACIENTSLRREISGIRDQIVRRESESSRQKKELDQMQSSLSSLMDDLRNCRVLLERRSEELSQSNSRIRTLEGSNRESLSAREKLDEQMSSERSFYFVQLNSIKEELAKERKFKDELKAQLDESRRDTRITRPPPVAAVFPQLSDRGTPRPDSANDDLTLKLPDDNTQYDRSLEDVLFGEDCSGSIIIESPKSVDELIDELNQMRIHAQNARELLSETEATNARLLEQGALLKEEIRRLQRNDERTQHLENIEYLKNVIIKFLSPEQVSSAKSQLIPILNTMLRLSSEEVQILQRAAQTDNTQDTSASWSSYMRWGGLS